jgi:hypothetical protein
LKVRFLRGTPASALDSRGGCPPERALVHQRAGGLFPARCELWLASPPLSILAEAVRRSVPWSTSAQADFSPLDASFGWLSLRSRFSRRLLNGSICPFQVPSLRQILRNACRTCPNPFGNSAGLSRCQACSTGCETDAVSTTIGGLRVRAPLAFGALLLAATAGRQPHFTTHHPTHRHTQRTSWTWRPVSGSR